MAETASAMQAWLARVLTRLEPLRRYWIGRVVMTSVGEASRAEIFDRSMVLAAQLFTSVFPILILFAVLISQTDLVDLADSMALPPATARVLEDIVGTSTPGSFGLFGALLVLVSATSLSRALARLYQVVWHLPKPPSRASYWWRWLAVVLSLAIALVVVRALVRWSSGLTPAPFWNLVVVTAGFAVLWLVVPYVLLVGALPWRLLAPGAVLAGFAVALVGRVGSLVLPASLEASQARYGTIGVAFTYLAFLYVAAFAFILGSLVGAVVVRDDGRLGAWLRGGETPPG